MIASKRFALVLIVALGTCLPSLAQAFCGFYVGGADTKVYNNATMVTLMREGKTTVLSMGNNYQGPAEDFAMVVPVPVVLQKDNVKILPREVFERLDKMAAPRLVEYWEQDPCPQKGWDSLGVGTIGHGSGTGSGYGLGAGGLGKGRTTVVVEAQFAVGEYEIVILSAEDATGLETWLSEAGYKIPAGAAPFLRPYVEQGSKFFVAKVNPKKVTFKDGMASLSPLRFHYQSDDFNLPIRLGLINAKDKQDLIVHILAREKRYELANYKNITIPTNLFVKEDVRQRFGEFYAALFDATLEKNPGSVVTEYAWSASSCDPCPEPTLTMQELLTLGLDVANEQIDGSPGKASTAPGGGFEGTGTFSSSVGRPPPPSGLQPTIRMGLVVVKGGLDKNIVRRYIRRVMPRIRFCYEKELTKNQRLAGDLVANFVINKDGLVSNSKVGGIKNKALRDCVAATFDSIQYPKPKDAKPIRVTQPLKLTNDPAPPRGRGWGFVGGSGIPSSWVLTRLHARYDQKSLGEDLVFQEAKAINGGTGGADDAIVKTSLEAQRNTFQGRYIIRHPWEGAIECEKPERNRWGHPPAGVKGNTAPTAATDLAFATRGGATLASMLGEAVPASASGPSATQTPTKFVDPLSDEALEGAPAVAETPPSKEAPNKDSGCSTGGASSWPSLLLLLIGLVALRRRR